MLPRGPIQDSSATPYKKTSTSSAQDPVAGELMPATYRPQRRTNPCSSASSLAGVQMASPGWVVPSSDSLVSIWYGVVPNPHPRDGVGQERENVGAVRVGVALVLADVERRIFRDDREAGDGGGRPPSSSVLRRPASREASQVRQWGPRRSSM